MKVKYIGLGEYPNVNIIKKYREQCSDLCKGMQDDLYIYFKTSKGIKKRKLFDNPKQ